MVRGQFCGGQLTSWAQLFGEKLSGGQFSAGAIVLEPF